MFIITGGGSGIGKALAESLATRKCPVLIIGRRKQLLQDTATFSPLISYLCADVSTEAGLEQIKQYLADTPLISGLINNAGTIHPIAPISSLSSTEWFHALNTNLNPALVLPQKLATRLKQGRVLNIGSGAAYFAIKGWAAYCVSKAALAMLTRCWQLESESTAFASVMPGIIDTDMQAIARQSKHMDAEQTRFYQQLQQTNRLISPETVAQFLVWLLLDIDSAHFSSKEWDIYDSSHHPFWLKEPHRVLPWDEL